MIASLISAALAGPPAFVQAVLDQMEQADRRLQAATYTLHQQEWKGGQMKAKQVIAVKYRRPDDLYLKWVGDVHRGREVLWRKGWNDGNLRVSPGPMVPTLDLAPDSSLVTRESRHPIWMAAIPRIVDRILTGARFLDARPDLAAEYRDLGALDVEGTPSRCYEADLPYDASPTALYAPRVRICTGQPTGLPSLFMAWKDEDGAFRLVEHYRFADLKAGAALGDADFDPENPAYGF